MATNRSTRPGTGSDQLSIDVQNVPCFASGTLIRTDGGEVAVEDLRVGDLVLTTSGKSRPIVRLGSTDVDIKRMARQPIRIGADAFGPRLPYRDLVLSPGHGLCVQVLDEVIVPSLVLANGTTIAQVDEVRVSYWHVELDAHDILYANGLPAESSIHVGDRGSADAGGDPTEVVRRISDNCRPYVAEGLLVSAVRERLKLRAENLGWRCETSPFAGLHVDADGERIEPVIDGLTARFELPVHAADVWLVSATSVPAQVMDSHDARRLGVLLLSLRIEDEAGIREIALDNALLVDGFHAVEPADDGEAQRWTNGRARLPAVLWERSRSELAIRVELAAPPLPKWVAPMSAQPARDASRLSLVSAA